MLMQWKNKIVGHADVDPEQLMAHPKNYRLHPARQQRALKGAIEDIGYIKSITVNKRTGRVVDGHLRVTLALRDGQKTIPVEYVDLNEAEEAEALAVVDPITGMAGIDGEKLNDLLMDFNTDNSDIMGLVAETLVDAGGNDMNLSEQNDLRLKEPVICPECGHEF